ncbi:cysteinyl-tRNA synthetase [Syntrophobotulus glycolicus DSM 8271]|uniref:Cysteine--tRNA ligase n=1 Tax=Syntrophobotulus glycolicus (strain DSM 8271 / FlGlyR) TaxID=645991 RepID=F0SXC4_SYNGF|nr:cysteine--tRNA ligase [Syntrophobotulus glycolicus]ADY54670.1 cysteinyl-tRNA synthetase [Syntrophobotulus glycolicus DSM 8271]
MTVKIYNTIHKEKEEFIPREAGKVAMYACGPTTYNYFHLGNARMLVVFDMVRRYLAYKGYEVTYVQNFTDVDDKIIKRASEENCEPLALAGRYIEEYYKDANALNIQPATVHPKATDHIKEMIEIIKGLEKKGLAYPVEGDVYFAVEHFPQYGRLSGRNLEDLQAGARVEIDDKKLNPMDFALWKKAKPGEPAWPSPWGDGRPGWHIECSAMALKYLGPNFDIHGGGGDLVFPHHENEIAQSEGYLDGEQFARYWMHNAFITVNQEKMSKSLGNFFMIRDILKKFPGEVVRFYLLGTHYRSPLDFDDEKLEMAARGLDRLKTSVRLAGEALSKGKSTDSAGTRGELLNASSKARAAFEEAMEDDFNSAQAYASLFDLAKEINTALNEGGWTGAQIAEARDTLIDLAGILGFDLQKDSEVPAGESGKFNAVMELVLELRAKARADKDWSTADLIRDRLKEASIILEDTAEGSRWYLK